MKNHTFVKSMQNLQSNFFNRNLFLFAILGTLTFKNEHDSMKSVSEKIQFQAEISGKYNVVIFYRVIA